MRRVMLWCIAILSLLLSGLAYAIGFVVGLVVAGLVAGYAWGWQTVNQPAVPIVEDEDE